MSKNESLHNSITPYGFRLESVDGIGTVGHDGIWSREANPRLVPDSESLVWKFVEGRISAQEVLEACMQRLDDKRMERLLTLAEAVRSIPKSDHWARGDRLVELRKYYREHLAVGAGELTSRQLAKFVGERIPAWLYLNAEYFPHELRIPDVPPRLFDAARRYNESRPIEERLSVQAVCKVVEQNPSAKKLKVAFSSLQDMKLEAEQPSRLVVPPGRKIADNVQSVTAGGQELSHLLLAYWLAVEDFRSAAFNPLSAGYRECEALEAVENRLFQRFLGRSPTTADRRALNPVDEENLRLAGELFARIAAEDEARRHPSTSAAALPEIAI